MTETDRINAEIEQAWAEYNARQETYTWRV